MLSSKYQMFFFSGFFNRSVAFIILKVLLCVFASTTPVARQRRALSSEGRNNNVQLIVQSFTFRVSPLPPLSLFKW